MIVACDFDGTLFKHDNFPNVGEPVPYALEIVKRLIASGHELILWTCRDGDSLDLAIDTLASHGVEFHHHNVHPNQDHLSNKIDADVFIDDKAAFCPLIPNMNGHPYVDWLAIEIWLKREGYYTIPLGA